MAAGSGGDVFSLDHQDLDLFLAVRGLEDAVEEGTYPTIITAAAVAEVAFVDAPERLTKGLARHPVPIMLLARLAVSTAWQGRRIGSGLLKDAMQRTLQAADIGCIRAFAVHAKDASAKRFYERFGFVPSATDSLHLFRLIKDLRRSLEE